MSNSGYDDVCHTELNPTDRNKDRNTKSHIWVKKVVGLTVVKVFFLFFIVFLVYLPTLRNGFVWDDDSLTQNVLLKTGSGLWKIWTSPSALSEYEKHYWPLVYSTFWVEYKLWDLNPFGYHLINVFLHSLNAVLLWIILRRICVPGSYLSAVIFALHPVHVESVAWIIERKDVLSGLFYLLSFLTYTHFDSKVSHKPSAPIMYALSLFFFLCAMLSKSITVSLPLAILFCIWWRRGRVERHELISLLPFFAIALILSAVDVFVYKQQEPIKTDLFIIGRILLASRAILFYMGKLFLPINLIPIYPKWAINIRSVGQYVFPISLIIILITLWLTRKRVGRGPFVSILFFIVTLGPVLGFINFGFMASSFVADRFQYLASIGLIALFSAIVVKIVSKLGKFQIWIGGFLAFLLLSMFGILTYKQSTIYKNAETLFKYTLSKNPNAWVAYAFLGNVMNERGELDMAISFYSEALRINPQQAKIQNNWGTALYKQGKIDEAINHFTQALLIKPEYANAHYHLAICLTQKGEYDKAIKHYVEAIRINPNHTAAKQNLEAILKKKLK